MKFNVTEVEFDFEDSQGTISFDDEIEIKGSCPRLLGADDEDDPIEEITCASGWCIKNLLTTTFNSNDYFKHTCFAS